MGTCYPACLQKPLIGSEYVTPSTSQPSSSHCVRDHGVKGITVLGKNQAGFFQIPFTRQWPTTPASLAMLCPSSGWPAYQFSPDGFAAREVTSGLALMSSVLYGKHVLRCSRDSVTLALLLQPLTLGRSMQGEEASMLRNESHSHRFSSKPGLQRDHDGRFPLGRGWAS